MNAFLVGVTIFISILVAASLYRVARGPTVFDRAIGAGLIGTNVILMLTLTGFVYGRPEMFVDLALAYAMLNFIGVVALARYFEGGEKRR